MNDTTDDLTVNWPALVAIGAAVVALFLSIFALGKALGQDPIAPGEWMDYTSRSPTARCSGCSRR